MNLLFVGSPPHHLPVLKRVHLLDQIVHFVIIEIVSTNTADRLGSTKLRLPRTIFPISALPDQQLKLCYNVTILAATELPRTTERYTF